MKALYDLAIKPLNDELGKMLNIPVREDIDMTEEGPEHEYHIVVRVDKDWNIKELTQNTPF
jgi:hypothetical protein